MTLQDIEASMLEIGRGYLTTEQYICPVCMIGSLILISGNYFNGLKGERFKIQDSRLNYPHSFISYLLPYFSSDITVTI